MNLLLNYSQKDIEQYTYNIKMYCICKKYCVFCTVFNTLSI